MATTQLSNAPASGLVRPLRTRLEPYWLVLPAMLILAFFFAGPAIYNIGLSFQELSLFDIGKQGEWVGFANFAEVLNDPATRQALFNTTLPLTIVTVVIRLFLGLGLALLLNASVFARWRLGWLVRSLILVPWVTPPVVAVAAWKWLLDARYGVVNQLLVGAGILDQGIPFLARTSTVWGAIETMLIWRELPFVVITFLAALQSIPTDLRDAARIDGANAWQIQTRIVLPLLKPVMAVVVLLTTIWTFNNFVYVWLATRGGPGDYTHVLATQMYTASFIDYRMGTGAAVGVVMSLIMFVFALIYFFVLFREK
ncbi:MAG: sugar ABC transporter permease [Candidatus Devosia phytovorans]|uniref:Sugar ABC transporter permease n=1 Tax=Candidatus Devosia phytovorans TaxID=3121372 RepID=A0AAJ6B0A2_9HYPH|nr:sugar ABC transporter permease [Devosia sp.]WEK04506.1 MAG: sugar ABC transporter permease [Devosia sp.]